MKFTDITESSHKCPHCGGPMFSEMLMMEKKDACYYKVKASAKVWPSAYASGRLVQCRKKGAGNYGNKSEGVAEGMEGRVVFSGTGANGVKYKIIHHGDDFMIHANGKHIDSYSSLQRAMSVLKNEVPGLKRGVAEGRVDYNFDIEDLKRLERIRDLATLKAQALALISKPSAKPMKPEKVEWFKNALERMNSPIKVIKLMYDLLLSGEGNAVVGTRSSMNPNSYRQRFGEQGVAEGGVLGFMTHDRPRVKKTTPLSTMRKEFEKEKTADMPNYVLGKDLPKNPQHVKTVRAAEEYSPEYDDEAGMAYGSLHTMKNAVEGLMQVIDDRDNLPEWCQEKISLAEDYLVTVWDYLQSEKAQGVDPEITEMFEAMDQLAEEMAVKNGVSADLVWEQFEALPDHVLYETAAWRRKEGKSKKGGLNAKGVASYRRENPGSKLQMAVTTKPSKLKPGSKAAKRRKSFCARMSGVKGPMKKPNGKPTRKALALRKWNC